MSDLTDVLDDFKTAVYNPTDGMYFGLLRGFCRSNEDPLKLGRIAVHIPSLHGKESPIEDDLPWAWAAFNQGGDKDTASISIPDVDSSVWVLFESGHVDHPVYFGTWWGESELPESLYEGNSPLSDFLYRRADVFARSRRDGTEFLLQLDEDTYLRFKKDEILIFKDDSTISLKGDRAVVNVGGSTVTIDGTHIDLSTGASNVNLGPVSTIVSAAGSSVTLTAGVAQISAPIIKLQGVVQVGP